MVGDFSNLAAARGVRCVASGARRCVVNTLDYRDTALSVRRATRAVAVRGGGTEIDMPPAIVRALGRLVNRARDRQREECALLFGRRRRRLVVREVLRVPNVARSATAFAIRCSDIDAAQRRHPDPLLGVFHTHVDGGDPSAADIASMRDTELLFVIGWPVARGRSRRLELAAWRAWTENTAIQATNRRSACCG